MFMVGGGVEGIHPKEVRSRIGNAESDAGADPALGLEVHLKLAANDAVVKVGQSLLRRLLRAAAAVAHGYVLVDAVRIGVDQDELQDKRVLGLDLDRGPALDTAGGRLLIGIGVDLVQGHAADSIESKHLQDNVGVFGPACQRSDYQDEN